jgi:hypothetical protein
MPPVSSALTGDRTVVPPQCDWSHALHCRSSLCSQSSSCATRKVELVKGDRGPMSLGQAPGSAPFPSVAPVRERSSSRTASKSISTPSVHPIIPPNVLSKRAGEKLPYACS